MNNRNQNNNKSTNEQIEKYKRQKLEDNKRIKRYRIIVIILALISVAVALDYMIEAIASANSGYTQTFFAKHFALGLSMILVGAIAIILPIIQSLSNKYQEGKGDQLLIMIGFILFLAGLVAIGGSFLGFL